MAAILPRAVTWGIPGGIWMGMATNHLEKLKNSERRKFAGVLEVVRTIESKGDWRIPKFSSC